MGGSPTAGALARTSTYVLFLRASGVALGLALTAVLGRVLGAEAYGAYALALAWLGLLGLLATVGFESVVLRFTAIYKERRQWGALKGVLKFTNTFTLAASCLVGGAGAIVVAAIPGMDRDVRWALLIAMGLVPISVFTIIRQASLRGLQQVVLGSTVDSLIYPGSLLALVVAGHLLLRMPATAPQMVVATGAAATIGLVFGGWALLRAIPREARGAGASYERRLWIEMAIPLTLVAAVQSLLNRGDIIMLGALGGTRDVGIYAVASRGAEFMLFGVDAAGLAGAPVIARLYAAGNRAELQRVITAVTRLIFWLGLPVALGMFIAAPWVLRIFGPEFAAGANVFRVLLVGQFLAAATGLAGVSLYMTGHHKAAAANMAFFAGLNVLLNGLLIPHFGMMGAAAATATAILGLKLTNVVLAYRRLGIVSFPLDLRWLLKRLPG